VHEYRYPPPLPLLEDVLVNLGIPRLVDDNVASPADAYWTPSDPEPPDHEEPLFVEGGVAVYVSRGRAFRGPVPPPPLPPLGHGAAGVPSIQWPGPSVGRGRAAGNAAIIRLLQGRGRSRNGTWHLIYIALLYASMNGFSLFTWMRVVFLPFLTV